MNKIRLNLNDKVIVISGKEKGKIGEIIDISRKKNSVKVKNINFVKKHYKAKQQGQKSGIINIEAYLNVSKVMPIDNLTNKPIRHKKLKRNK